MMKKLNLLGFFIATSFIINKIQAQSFYDENTIQQISITFSQSNWDYMLDTAKNGAEGFILAQSVTINGVTFDSVGVKYKGNSSYNANNTKNPLHIALDYVHGNADYQGYTDVKLSNGKSDPSFVREVLSYKILRNYMFAPLANWAQVRINGTLMGLYTNVESINKAFIDDRFSVTGQPIVKCNPQNVMNTSGLQYLGTDSSLYATRYEIKSDFGWNRLVNLIDTLNNQSTYLDNILDIDRALWMLAFNNVLVNLDSYSGSFAQNYYLSQDDNNRFNCIVWDLNMSFGSFGMTGTGTPLSVTQMQQMSSLLHATNTARPLINKLLQDARYKRMYLAHMKTMLQEYFGNNAYLTEAQNMMTVVDTAVQSDVNKFYTYANFQNSLTTSVTGGGGGGGSIPGIQQLMNARNTYLMATTEFTATAPSISNIATSTPTINTSVTVTASVSNATYVKLAYRYAATQKFIYVTMFDDGAHGDGASGDGVYGGDFPMNAPLVQYYLYADNTNAGIFSPQRAEHEFYLLQAQGLPIGANDVVINELMASNVSIAQDPAGQFADWIELYNNTNNVLELGGIYMTDNPSNLQKWYFPIGTSIAANGFLIVWADEDLTESGLHAGFKLGSGGETVILSNTNGSIIDSVSYPASTPDMSYERYPNGTGAFTTMAPTFNAHNSPASGIVKTDLAALKMYPNPTSGMLIIDFPEFDETTHVQIYNSLGQLVLSAQNIATNRVELNFGDLPAGMYSVQSQGFATQRILKL